MKQSLASHQTRVPRSRSRGGVSENARDVTALFNDCEEEFDEASAVDDEGFGHDIHCTAGVECTCCASPLVDTGVAETLTSALRYQRCSWAWVCLAVGNADEAARASEANNDLVGWAAALALSGKAEKALIILESYVIALCVTVEEALSRHLTKGTSLKEAVLRRHNEVVALWLLERQVETVDLTDCEYRRTLQMVISLVDWRTICCWYAITLTLLQEEASTGPYVAPVNVWFRYFFALFPAGVPRFQTDAGGVQHGIPQYLEELDSSETLSLLLSVLSETETLYISVVTAFYTQHFRSCLVFATNLLERALAPQTALPTVQDALPRLCLLTTRMLRCRAALEVAERPQACVDAVFLLQYKSVETFDTHAYGKGAGPSDDGHREETLDEAEAYYVRSVAAAVCLYGLPLPQAIESVLVAACDRELPVLARQFVFALAGYVHTLTLLHAGEIDACADLAFRWLNFASRGSLTEGFHDIIARCGVANEDSTMLLSIPLLPHRLLYVALSPAFFGGLSRDGVRLRRKTATFNLLYPSYFSSYMPVRQLLPFHMNRSFYFCARGNLKEAWDDICCAVAAADEIVGSAEFAFTECFPLRVYFFGCQIALLLVEQLLQEEISAVAACLGASRDDRDRSVEGNRTATGNANGETTAPLNDQTSHSQNGEDNSAASNEAAGSTNSSTAESIALVSEKKKVYVENDELMREAVTLSHQWTQQIRRYYPHSVLGEVARARGAVLCHEADMLRQAVLLSARFPTNTLARNTLSLALYFNHNISESMDTAQKNFEDFPHAKDVAEVKHRFEQKDAVYVFNYRTLVPLRYKPGDGHRKFTKRMIIAIVLLLLNFAIVLLTLLLNLPESVTIPESMRGLALRLQLPSLVPLFFAAVCFVHAVVASATSRNLIGVVLSDNHFCDNPLSRFLFALRGMALINVVNALQISISGNNFLFDSAFYTVVLYVLLSVLFVPFTSRVWFLPSVDEPKVGVLSWVTLLGVDAVTAYIVVIPHVILAVLEPLLFVVFSFFLPPDRPRGHHVSGSVRRRLLYHEQHRYEMPGRFSLGSGSHFLHVRLMSGLYWRTHSARATLYLEEAQMDAEGYRAFPLVDPQAIGLRPWTAEKVTVPASEPEIPTPRARQPRMPLDEPLFAQCDPGALDELRSARTQAAAEHDESAQGAAANGAVVGGTEELTSCAEADDAGGRDSPRAPAAAPVYPLTRTSSRIAFNEREEFAPTSEATGRLVDVVRRQLELLEKTDEKQAKLQKRNASFVVRHAPRGSFRLADTLRFGRTRGPANGSDEEEDDEEDGDDEMSGGIDMNATATVRHTAAEPTFGGPAAAAPQPPRHRQRRGLSFTLDGVPEVMSVGSLSGHTHSSSVTTSSDSQSPASPDAGTPQAFTPSPRQQRPATSDLTSATVAHRPNSVSAQDGRESGRTNSASHRSGEAAHTATMIGQQDAGHDKGRYQGQRPADLHVADLRRRDVAPGRPTHMDVQPVDAQGPKEKTANERSGSPTGNATTEQQLLAALAGVSTTSTAFTVPAATTDTVERCSSAPSTSVKDSDTATLAHREFAQTVIHPRGDWRNTEPGAVVHTEAQTYGYTDGDMEALQAAWWGADDSAPSPVTQANAAAVATRHSTTYDHNSVSLLPLPQSADSLPLEGPLSSEVPHASPESDGDQASKRSASPNADDVIDF